jgi:fructose-1,6-bisphosphatase/inositol monophosphatase family enzyme
VSARFESSHWVHGPLHDLATRIRKATHATLLDSVARGSLEELSHAHGAGAGDVTYGIDVPAEQVLQRWFEEIARREPISLLSEDAGWRHLGPGRNGGVRELDGFDHGGVRVAVDPVDGTRNLMADLRSAWSVIAVCGPGPGIPRLSDAAGGVLSEIPDSRGSEARLFRATTDGGVRCSRESVRDGSLRGDGIWHADGDDRADNGYFPFFRYAPDMRPDVARIEAAFFARLEAHEKADVRTCWDDQYISNGGQLALLTLGTYRMIADLRAFLARRSGRTTPTCKPYDCAGAIVVARAAGCIVTSVGGEELDFEIDTSTPVSFAGWANARTRARLEPHLNAVLA